MIITPEYPMKALFTGLEKLPERLMADNQYKEIATVIPSSMLPSNAYG